MALALVLVGAGLGGSISAPLVTRVVAAAHGNWRAGWFCLFAAALTVALVSILFVKNRPEEVGQVADGDTKPASKVCGDVASRARTDRTRDHWTMRETVHTPHSGCSLWPPSANLFRVPRQSPTPYRICVTSATRRQRAAPHSQSFFVGSLIIGFLCDRMDPRIAWAVCILMLLAATRRKRVIKDERAAGRFVGKLMRTTPRPNKEQPDRTGRGQAALPPM
jgi:hypothetical protein